MDDILSNINNNEVDVKLSEINNLHPALIIYIQLIPFLNMKIERWYIKPTDTGLMLNFH